MLRIAKATLLILTVCLILSFCLILPVAATPCAVLKVSLPTGTYVGYNSDPWLCECWLLNLTGASQTFTVRINNTSSSLRSYDTHLIVALNDAGYNKLLSLVINGIDVPKSAFKFGTPRPYNLWNWPSGDVYPTYFDDTYIKGYTIYKKGFKDFVVSVTFSDASCVRMHFDAYGKRVSGTPPNDGYITHNSISKDSTVQFQVGPPPPQPPIASFFYNPLYPETYQVTTFNASASYDPDGNIVSYAWNFGDGTPIVVEYDPITDHTYTAYGDFTVTLTVTDNSGLTDNETKVIHITQHPVASFTMSPPDPLIHETVIFDASGSTPDGGDIVSYEWIFGDGNVTRVSDPVISHAYSTLGTYTVTLNVTDSEGKWDTQSQQITVEGAPIADFWWSPYYPQRLEDVTFDASSSTPDGGYLVSYAWDFGDGTPIVEEDDPIATHSYTATGDYLVTLNVTDSEGRWDTESRIITVVPIRYFLEVETDPADIVPISGEGWYNEGASVDLDAPEYVTVSTGVRYRFDHWDVNGTTRPGNPITVIMDANYKATAHYIMQYYLTVTSPHGTPGGEDWYDKDAPAYATVTPLIVPGAPGVQYVFTHWSGDATGNTSPSDPILMNAPKTAIANWKTQYQITVTASPSGALGRTFKVTYTSCGTIFTNVQKTTPWTGWADESTSVIVSEPQDIIDVSLGTRYKFDHYDPSSSVAMTEAETITLVYKTQYMVSFTQTGSGVAPTVTYTADTDPTETVPFNVWVKAGTEITYTYQAVVPGAAGVRYVLTGVTPSSPQTVNSPMTISGSYKTQYLLTVLTDPAGLSPQPTRVPAGEPGPANGWWYDTISVSLTAQSVTGYSFSHWTVDGFPQGSGVITITVPMDGPHTAIAHYTQIITYTLAISTPTGGTTNPEPGTYTYSAGSRVEVRAIPNPNYIFDHWELDGENVGSANPYVFFINKNCVLEAVFTYSPPPPPGPVGGYSVSLITQIPISQVTLYTMLITLFGVILSLTKRKRK